MAVLRNGESHVHLQALHVFGRNAAKADTLVSNSDASQIHAVITWSGQAWEIADLSRNGTFLDGKRLPANIKTSLRIGQAIRCALENQSTWLVTDLAAPCPMLLPVNGTCQAIALGTFQLLPCEDNPITSVHLTGSGQWMFDDQDGTFALNDGDRIHAGGNVWRLALPLPLGATTAVNSGMTPAPDLPTFDFFVSQNEEHIQLSAKFGGEQIDFGERAHHYSLLTLARRRFADHERGLDALAQGWLGVDQLSKMLGIEPSHLNIQLFRARSQIMGEQRAKYTLPDLIERRRGEVRLRAYPFRITRGMELEAHFNVHAGAPSSPHSLAHSQ